MDAGGKIRTANLLKNLKGGAFEIDLMAPATAEQAQKWRAEINACSDCFSYWRPSGEGAAYHLRRASGIASSLPISIRSDITSAAAKAVHDGVSRRPDLVVFDYAHGFALRPWDLAAPSLLFAHNVEAEILQRHAARKAALQGWLWRREAMKMARFENAAARCADGVIAVSSRDAAYFRDVAGARYAGHIPTGVDLDFFNFAPSADDRPVITFTGSLDWRANQDGLIWFLNDIWPQITQRIPNAEFVIVGKNPPRHLVSAARAAACNWRFTGFVDDIRPHARGLVYVIPLRVGGGTRIKAFEAMAMGVPVVSTALGVEGLPMDDGAHYRRADTPEAFAAAVVSLLTDKMERLRLANAARKLVEAQASHASAAAAFEKHCMTVLDRRAAAVRNSN